MDTELRATWGQVRIEGFVIGLGQPGQLRKRIRVWFAHGFRSIASTGAL